ncbi:hypothetical protein [Rickettsiales endosymbiont of Stachyamoeba lipophora]|uniref:hypothetical protein n=1 Tax=Rickettsiales endosymbiont of Stachyamoeba lipophora TaxID=2486578 RepID=UPI000F650FC9|nr:hypothetical protein [Rickettsiales endosymbiont of Stachyamoeba lipophora]AZL16200.1 hypothetical protein EF513_06625 [Rickettsiales endosymbiont of Stachyamoeba lipophora]
MFKATLQETGKFLFSQTKDFAAITGKTFKYSLGIAIGLGATLYVLYFLADQICKFYTKQSLCDYLPEDDHKNDVRTSPLHNGQSPNTSLAATQNTHSYHSTNPETPRATAMRR